MQFISADEIGDGQRQSNPKAFHKDVWLTKFPIEGVIPDDVRWSRVSFAPGAVATEHAHEGGQVIYAVDGVGFVESGGERRIMRPGDVAVSAPGEWHSHGAVEGSTFVHLTYSVGAVFFPED